MGLFDWLKSLLIPSAVARDVSRLTSDHVGAGADTTKEMVDRSGKQPLKPMQRRLALRDGRLLPKSHSTVGRALRFGRTRYLQRDEADRLFSATMRTANRHIRDLATDEEQLRRYGLPLWTSEHDIAAALGLTVSQLRHYSIHRAKETSSHYVAFAIPKRSGGQRIIHAPKRRLKAILRALHAQLVEKLPISPYAHGFRKQHSVASNAAPHVGKRVVIRLDIADCFPSLHFGRVRGLLIAYGYGYPVAQTLAVLMTEAIRQPLEIDGKIYQVPAGPRTCVQGAPTSPGLCNALLRRLDYRLAGLARKYGFAYTRYADDLTFSGDDKSKIKLLVTFAGRIAREEQLSLNRAKTRVQHAGQSQTVTGVTVNRTAGLSRQQRRLLRAALHRQRVSPSPDPRVAQQLAGKLAYVRMLNLQQAAALERANRTNP